MDEFNLRMTNVFLLHFYDDILQLILTMDHVETDLVCIEEL